jgi:hypothetical protein
MFRPRSEYRNGSTGRGGSCFSFSAEIGEESGQEEKIYGRDGRGHESGVESSSEKIIKGEGDDGQVRSQDDPAETRKMLEVLKEQGDRENGRNEGIIPTQGGNQGNEEEKEGGFGKESFRKASTSPDEGQNEDRQEKNDEGIDRLG